jgi:O-antigen/teichoic acid export membrane protein
LQLSQHIGKAVWSTADKMLYVLLGLAYILPQKMIGAENWGIFVTAQAILTAIFTLSDGSTLQILVTFGMREDRRRQALTFSAIAHLFFIGIGTAAIYLCRYDLARLFGKPQLAGVLDYFPLMALGFLARSYLLKVSQLYIDTRSMFIIDAAWIISLLALIGIGWKKSTLATSEDMMLISAASAGFSSLVALVIYGRRVRWTVRFERALVRQFARFGTAQLAAAATIVVQTQGDLLVLAWFASAATVGNYDVAKKFFRAFEAMREAGSMVVYPAAARLRSQGRETEMVLMIEKMIGFMLVVIVPVVLLVWLLPIEHLFAIVFKKSYPQAAQIFRTLSLAALAIPFVLNLNVLHGLGEARAGFKATFLASITFFAVALILIPLLGRYGWSALGSALATVASFAVLAVFSTVSVQRHVPFSVLGAIGRWRDAFEYALRFWRKRRPAATNGHAPTLDEEPVGSIEPEDRA